MMTPQRPTRRTLCTLAWMSASVLSLAGEGSDANRAVREANVVQAKVVCELFESIPVRDDHGPGAVCHGILANGPDFQIVDHATGGTIRGGELVLRKWSFALIQDAAGLRFRRAIVRRTYERHACQFTAYLLTAGFEIGPTKVGLRSESAVMGALWQREKVECHALRDMSWFIPAYCMVGDYSPFLNKFGETLTTDDLVRALLEQSQAQGKEASCGGMHQLLALCWARQKLANAIRPELSEKLLREVEQRLAELDRFISSDGELDIAGYIGQAPSGKHSEEWTVNLAGHVIELASLGFDPPPLADSKLDALVSRTLKDCLELDCWLNAESLLSRDGPLDYACAAHLVRGLRLYVQGRRSAP